MRDNLSLAQFPFIFSKKYISLICLEKLKRFTKKMVLRQINGFEEEFQ